MKRVFASEDTAFNDQISSFISNFDNEGLLLNNGERNVIKTKKIGGVTVNVKSFKEPNIVNKIVYRFFRKSKAQRSFEYAKKLTVLNVGTPLPLAYFEFCTLFSFKNSFYISEQIYCDLTYRELTTNFEYPDYENILRAFTKFTFNLHEKGIHFLDHSPGNTLIKKTDNGYLFFLVDLNRMEFKPLDFKTRIKNFSRLTIHKSMIKIMSDEYAQLFGEDYTKVFNLMWRETEDFQNRYYRKKRLKKHIKFWKK
jgi:hypothetical protein